MDTQLELKEYFFPVVQVVAEPDTEEFNEPFEFTVDVSISEGEIKDEKLYQVSVEIESIPEEPEQKQQYSFHLVVVGFFTVNQNHPDIWKLLYINGSSILFGAAREFLITVTSRGPWPAVSLPSISFLNKYKEDIKAIEKERDQENTTETEKDAEK